MSARGQVPCASPLTFAAHARSHCCARSVRSCTRGLCRVRAVTLNPDVWTRTGRGRSFQFFASDGELQHLLDTVLPSEFEPYQLVGADKVREDGAFVELPFAEAVRRFHECCIAAPNARFTVWIHSRSITPELVLRRGSAVEATCAVNGLVLVQHGTIARNYQTGVVGRDPTRLGVVHRVVHSKTGEVKSHESYARVFDALRRAVRRQLRFAAIYRFPTGEREVPGLGITEGAASSHSDGIVVLSHRPGRHL